MKSPICMQENDIENKVLKSHEYLISYKTMCSADAPIIVYFPRAAMEKHLLFGSKNGKLDKCSLHEKEAPG